MKLEEFKGQTTWDFCILGQLIILIFFKIDSDESINLIINRSVLLEFELIKNIKSLRVE